MLRKLSTFFCTIFQSILILLNIGTPVDLSFVSDVRTSRLLSRRVVRAAKDHVCDFTGKPIRKGDYFIRVSAIHKRKFTTRKAIITPRELASFLASKEVSEEAPATA